MPSRRLGRLGVVALLCAGVVACSAETGSPPAAEPSSPPSRSSPSLAPTTPEPSLSPPARLDAGLRKLSRARALTTYLSVTDDAAKVADVEANVAPRQGDYAGVIRMFRHLYREPPAASYIRIDGEQYWAANFLGKELMGCSLRLGKQSPPQVERWFDSLPFDTVGLLRRVRIDGVAIGSDEVLTGTVAFRELIPMIMSMVDYEPPILDTDVRVPIEISFDGTTLVSWRIDEVAVERQSSRLPASQAQRRLMLVGRVDARFTVGDTSRVPLRRPTDISPDGRTCGPSEST